MNVLHSYCKIRIKKIIYYNDIGFFLSICWLYFRITIADSSSLIKLADCRKLNSRHSGEKIKIKIEKYTAWIGYLYGKLGFSDTCMKHSIVLCYMFRRYAGVDARINFGVSGADTRWGHCWVTADKKNESLFPDYQVIFEYPASVK